MDLGAELGQVLIEEALTALRCDVSDVSAYGKAAVVGTNGEIEHAAALIDHAPLANQLPGARRIVFNACHDTTEIDGISELWFDSEAEFVAAYESDLGKRVAADSLAHVRLRTRMFVTEHAVVDSAL